MKKPDLSKIIFCIVVGFVFYFVSGFLIDHGFSGWSIILIAIFGGNGAGYLFQKWNNHNKKIEVDV